MSLAIALQAVSRKTGDIYVATISDSLEIVFRLPSLKRVKQYVKLLDFAEDVNPSLKASIYEHLFQEIIEDKWLGTEATDIPAGIAQSLAETAIYLSGISNDSVEYLNGLMKACRNNTETVEELMKRIIASTFNAYTFENIEELDYPRIVYLYIQAEKILLDRGIIKQEMNITTEEDRKEAAIKSLHQQIKMDSAAYNTFNASQPNKVDPRYEEARKQIIEQAKKEDRKHRKRMSGES